MRGTRDREQDISRRRTYIRLCVVSVLLLVAIAGFRHSTRMSASLEKISFDGIPGFVGGPKDRPAVIVLQEWWGVTDEIKDQAHHLSNLGNYRVMIPDLYKGAIGVDAEEASHVRTLLHHIFFCIFNGALHRFLLHQIYNPF